MGRFSEAWDILRGKSYKLTDHISPSIQFMYNNGELVWQRNKSINDIKDIYETCAPVSSMIDNMADAFVNADFQAVNYSPVRQKKRDINYTWQAVIDNPNWMQDREQFMKQLYTYRKMFGWCYVLKMKSTGFETPSSLWVLPPWLLKIEYKESGLYLTDKNINRIVKLIWGNKEILLDKEDLILFTDTTNLYNDDNWMPLPRIFTKQYSLTLLTSILEAETTLIQNKGALGIISSDQQVQGVSKPLTKDQKEDLQSQWSKYGLSRTQWQMIFSNGAIKYTPLVFDAAQLQLKEGYLSALKDLADGLHYPFVLAAHSDQSTYNNVTSAEKALYQNAIIPDAKSIMRTLTQGLIPVNNVRFEASYEHIQSFQESKKDEADARKVMNEALKIEWDNGLITKNMWLEELEEERVPNPLFDKYKFELTPEELGIINTGYGNNQNQSGQGGNSGNQNNQGNSN